MGEGMIQDQSDEDLMKAVAKANQSAFRTLVNRHMGRANTIAMRSLPRREDAEEAVQDSFCKIWVNAASFDPDKAKFMTWFVRILTNTCLDKIRSNPPRAGDIDALADVLADDAASYDAQYGQKREGEAIRKAVQTLPDRQRMAVILCYFEEMTNPQAAEVLGINVKALEGLLVRARRDLKGRLGAGEDNDG